MQLELRHERDGARIVLVASGEIDLATVDALRAAITQGFSEAPEVCVDLTRVEFLDSSGLAALVDGHRTGPLTVICPDGLARHVLAASGVDRIVRVLAGR